AAERAEARFIEWLIGRLEKARDRERIGREWRDRAARGGRSFTRDVLPRNLELRELDAAGVSAHVAGANEGGEQCVHAIGRAAGPTGELFAEADQRKRRRRVLFAATEQRARKRPRLERNRVELLQQSARDRVVA